MWLWSLLTSLGLPMTKPTILYIDNQLVIAISQNSEFHNHAKHIEIQHHFLHQLVDDKQIDSTYLPTGEQLADALTKGLTCKKHNKFAHAMGLRDAV